MPLTVTAKDRIAIDLADPAGVDLRTAFLQVERYTQQLETVLGFAIGSGNVPLGPKPTPVGGLVFAGSTPPTVRTYTNVSNVPVGSVTFPVVGGQRYLLTVFGSGSVTVAVPTFVNIAIAGATPAPLPAGPSWLIVSQNNPPVTSTLTGQATAILTGGTGRPGVTVAETVSISASSSSATAVFTIQPNAVQIYVTRVS